MQLETPWQRIVAFGIVLAFLAIVMLVVGWIVTSLDGDQKDALGNWLDDNSSSMLAGVAAVVPAVATYLFGHRSGRRQGKTEAYNSAIATSSQKADGNAAAEELRKEARAHDLRVTT